MDVVFERAQSMVSARPPAHRLTITKDVVAQLLLEIWQQLPKKMSLLGDAVPIGLARQGRTYIPCSS